MFCIPGRVAGARKLFRLGLIVPFVLMSAWTSGLHFLVFHFRAGLHSYHNALLLSFRDRIARPSFFRFRSMWLTHNDFLSFVRDEWAKALVLGSPMRVFMCKLKHLRSALRQWNFAILGISIDVLKIVQLSLRLFNLI